MADSDASARAARRSDKQAMAVTELDGNPALQRSLAEGVTARIRHEILSGGIRPGERLRLRTLEELLGISHIPIREALRQLEAEGLVENIPQRGAIATRISVAELTDVYDLRKLLEPLVAARAIESISEERLGEIRYALGEMDAIEEGWRSPLFANLHRKFHWAILEPGATKVIEQVLRQLWQTSERYVRFSVTVGSGGAMADEQHRHLYSAARKRDPDLFASELVAHLAHTEARVRKVLAEETLEPSDGEPSGGGAVRETNRSHPDSINDKERPK